MFFVIYYNGLVFFIDLSAEIDKILLELTLEIVFIVSFHSFIVKANLYILREFIYFYTNSS